MRFQVIGVGSPWGADEVGLRVAERLGERGLPADTRALACPRPFPDLLEPLSRADHVILVDGVRGGLAPGELLWLSRAMLARRAATSSHGMGVARVLDLAEALGHRPRALAILGIEIGDGSSAVDGAGRSALDLEVGSTLDPAARDGIDRAIERACDRIEARIAAWRGGPSPSPSSSPCHSAHEEEARDA